MEEEKKYPNIMLTGDRPTGRLHIGHYVGSLKRRVELQNQGGFDEMYIMIADTQALTDNAGNIAKVRDNVIQVALDYLACGIDPSKVTIFVQSRIPELFEFTCYFMDLVTLSRLERNPTVKAELGMRGFGESIPVGFLTYPISQASDILAFGTTIVPAGEDQMPMVEQAQEIAHKFNSLYGEVFPEPKIMLPETAVARRLCGTDGKAKMSKSLGNAIYLSDDAKTVEKAVMSMFTDPTHLNVSDPGHTEGNPVFIYLEAFATDEHFAKYLPEYPNLEALEEHYRRGGLGDVTVKRFLVKVLNDVLEPIRQRRHEFEKDIASVYRILEEGTAKAREAAAKIAFRARRAMGINYFEDKKHIEKQQKAFNRAHEQEAKLAEYLAKQKK
ncbi:MAG: tryptophan--tRNA ligase [Erysipelotrichaceae bacterium]|jgi:tryptophanyl-tRNA synthetase|nr:tryptophan--tRNA ligase [Erysipelotrichaceae bacterium]